MTTNCNLIVSCDWNHKSIGRGTSLDQLRTVLKASDGNSFDTRPRSGLVP